MALADAADHARVQRYIDQELDFGVLFRELHLVLVERGGVRLED